MADALFCAKQTHEGADLVVELLVTGIEGFQFFTNEFVQYAPVYQCLTQLSDLRPVVPRVTQRTLQRLVMDGEMGERKGERRNKESFERKKKRKGVPQSEVSRQEQNNPFKAKLGQSFRR